MKAVLNGVVVAESTETVVVEGNHYFPKKGVNQDYFSDCDILVEGFDVKETKKDFLEVFGNSGKFIVSANGIGGTNLEKITIKKLGNKIYIVGDFISEISIYKTFPTKVSIVAAMMANIILEKCFGVNENV